MGRAMKPSAKTSRADSVAATWSSGGKNWVAKNGAKMAKAVKS